MDRVQIQFSRLKESKQVAVDSSAISVTAVTELFHVFTLDHLQLAIPVNWETGRGVQIS